MGYRSPFGVNGQSGTPTHRIWYGIRQRCILRPKKGYAGLMCERWANSFPAFLEDMGERPEGLSIDRIDNSRGYEPGNCRWATHQQQQNNKPNNRRLTFRGEILSIAQWAVRTGLSWRLIYGRVFEHGWSVERALTEKPIHYFLTYRGQSKPIAYWAKKFGLPITTIRLRIYRYHWPVSKALKTKKQNRGVQFRTPEYRRAYNREYMAAYRRGERCRPSP